MRRWIRRVGNPGENRGQVVAHWKFQPAAAFHDRENGRTNVAPNPAPPPVCSIRAVNCFCSLTNRFLFLR